MAADYAPRTARRLTAVLGLSAALLAVWCAPALGHAQLLQSEPAADANLTESPVQARLRFNEPVEAEFSPLEVYDSEGNRVDEDNARVDPEDARVLLADLGQLPEGTYTVDWRVTSIDGHVIEGTYEFTVGDEEAVPETSAEDTEASLAAAGAEPAARRDGGAGGLRGWHFAALGLAALTVVSIAMLRGR